MNQTPCEPWAARENLKFKAESAERTSPPYVLRRLIYVSVLVALLLAACFYLDFLSDYDLVTVVLGFVVCIILQFIVLSSVFREQMKELQTDEIGVLKQNIKMVFGQLNPARVELKSRHKYYHRQPNEEDKLFSQENDAIYRNVMARLRAGGEPNFNELIAKVKGKWQQLENKVRKIEQFLSSVLRLYQSRKLAYFKQKNRLKRLHQNEEHTLWDQFLMADDSDGHCTDQILCNSSLYSQDDQAFGKLESAADTREKKVRAEEAQVSWGILNTYLLEKIKLAEKQFSDLKERVCKQFECFAATVRNSSSQSSKSREKIHEDFRNSDVEKNNLLLELEKTASKIVQVSQGLSARVVGGSQIESTMKREFELRLLKIESQNLLIRLSRAQSCCLSYTDQLFRHLETEGRDLQYLLQTINNKIHQYNHQMAGFGQNRAPAIKKMVQEGSHTKLLAQPIGTASEATIDESYARILTRRSNQGTFRGHLEQLLSFFEVLKQEHSKTSRELKAWRENFHKNSGDKMRESKVMGQSSQARFLQFTKGINDQKLLRMFDVVNDLEHTTCKQIHQLLLQQIECLRQFEANEGSVLGQEVRRLFEECKKKENEHVRLSKRSNKLQKEQTQRAGADYELSKNKLAACIKDYSQRKIRNYLPDIIRTAVTNEEGYQQLASQLDTDRADDQRNQYSSADDGKCQKYEAFTNCLTKTYGEQLIDEVLSTDRFSYQDSAVNSEVSSRYLIDLGRDAAEGEEKSGSKRPQRVSDFFKYQSSVPRTLAMLNNILGVLFHEWSNSELFHEFIKEELLLVSLNRKKPEVVEHLRIDFFRIVERDKDTPILKNLRPHQSEIYRCLFDLHLNFKGKIAVQISSRVNLGKQPDLRIKLLIKEFECPIRVCLTPFSIGKSYVSFVARPRIVIDYSVGVGGFHLTKIPFFTQLIKTYIVLKLRKKFLWPKRMTLSVPLAYKSTLDLAIEQRKNYEKQKERLSKKTK